MPKLSMGAAALVLMGVSGVCAAGTTGALFLNTTNSPLGGGTQQFLPPDSQLLFFDGGSSVGVSIYGKVQGVAHTWNLTFGEPIDQAFGTGSFAFANPLGVGSPMFANLTLVHDSQACNISNAWFDVREFALDSTGAVSQLAVDFYDQCFTKGPLLYGSVRLNSSYPLEIPTLQAVAGRDVAVVEGTRVTLNGTQSFTRGYGPLHYQWTQISGPSVSLNNSTWAKPTFTAPAVGVAGADLQFQLQVTDRLGNTSTNDVIVVDMSKSAARTALTLSGGSGDPVVGWHNYSYNTFNALFDDNSFIDSSSGAAYGAETRVWGDQDWTLDFSVPAGTKLQPGSYSNAVNYPQGSSNPGLSLWRPSYRCSDSTGSFNIYQVSVDASNQPKTLDMDFTQYCGSSKTPAKGELTINAVAHSASTAALKSARERLRHPAS